MKKISFTTLLIFLSLISLDVKSQNSYHFNDVVNNREAKIELKESFYRQLMVHPLLTDENRSDVRSFYISHIGTYQKLIVASFKKKQMMTKEEISFLFAGVVDQIIADYNKDKRFLKFKAEYKHSENENHNHSNEKKGDGGDKIPNGPCVNMGFENCDFTAWDLTQGFVDANPYGFITPTATTNWGNGSVVGFPSGSGGDQHFIVNAGTDPNVPIQMVNPNNGGTCSALIGDGTAVNSHASKISQTFLVDPTNADFSYSYAAVLEDPSGHTLGEKPYFSAKVFDQNGNAIVCGDFQSTAGDGSPGWVNTGTVQYKDWSTVIVPLQAYIGQNVTVEFTVGDCSQSGHYGYAYVEASCIPLEIIPSDTVVCGVPITLSAPSPFNGTYLWSTGATSASITTSNPGLYTVDMITAPGCFITLDVTIVADSTQPHADFIADTVCLGAATQFTDMSTSPTGNPVNNWDWDFDNDGTVDNTTQNPTFNFAAPGTYPVNLATGFGACGHDTTINVVVNELPVADFSFTNECFGTSTSFTDLSNPNGGTITTWQWDFDNNGVVDNTTQNPTNGYAAAGTYTAELYVAAAGGCADSITKQVVVNPIPVANFSTSPGCLGIATVFTDLSTIITGNIASWAWDFGDASGTSVVQSPTYTYAAAGNYTVTLTVTSDSGCIHTFNTNVDVFAMPTAAFTTTDVCLNVLASFTDNSNGNGDVINNWAWDFGNASGSSALQNPTYGYLADGAYIVELIVTTANGCKDTVSNPITIFAMPTADFTFVNACMGTAIDFTDNSSVTSGAINNWDWNFGNTNTSIIQSPSENYASEGVYNVQLIVTSDNTCKDTIVKPIEVWPTPIPNFTPAEVCLNAITQFTDLSTVSNTSTANSVTGWNWDFNGLGSSATQNPTFTFNAEGSFPTTLVVTTNNGCTDSITINVVVNPLPVISFGPDTMGCAPVCVTMTNTSSISSGTLDVFSWDFGDGSSSGSQFPSHCFDNESNSSVMTYDVTLTATSNKGCSTTLTNPQMVTVYPIPLAHFAVDPEITDELNKEITFTDLSIIATNWDWDMGDGTFSTNTNPIHEYPGPGNYLVTLYIENQYGCRDTTDKLVKINPTYAIWIPNVFTPDGDEVNNYFAIEGFGILEVDLRIFDRWGLQLYHKVGPKEDAVWNGVYKGEIVQDDVYVYKVRIKDIFNKYHDIIGRVTVIK